MGTNEEIRNVGNKAFQKDYNFGIEKENEIREYLENSLGYKINVGEDEMSILDWEIVHKKKRFIWSGRAEGLIKTLTMTP